MTKEEKSVFLNQGLISEEVKKRLEKFGPNQLVKPRELTDLKLLFSQFKSPLVYILVLAGLVTFFLREYTDSIVIFSAVLINTLLGFWQERKAQRALVALRSLLAQKAKVIRDGQQQIIDAKELVPGDLVILTIGTRVPADGVVIEAADLSLNEAILTGESLPVEKKATKWGDEAKIAKEENKNHWVYMGTNVLTGIAKMVVIKTGMETEMGKIGKRVTEVEEEKTPLQKQLGKLAKILAIVVGVVTFLIFVFGEFLGYEPLEMFTTSVAVAVAAIPEGLVVTLTVILALGMQRILKRKAIVRKLVAAETLGSVTVICADKTGTLTEGEMKVVKAELVDEKKATKELLVQASVLCNDMRDPLEVGMLNWAEQQLDQEAIKQLREKYKRLDEKPFSPETKIIATLHPSILFVSGAPEVILARSKLNQPAIANWQKKFEEAGQKAYRLVAFAYKKVKTDKKEIGNKDLESLEWLGVLIYEDPIRMGVKKALDECQQAGIEVKVITGDHRATAVAVMQALGFEVDPDQLMLGDELEKIPEKEFRKKVARILLFARTNPEQKLKIVQALQENGEVVAMTGDGVNDAPAIKQADIGIVVGEASDVAKETADIVLLDSDFATIVAAVEEGRSIFENIKKVVLYLLSDSFTEVILIGGSLLLGLPLPVTAVQILWVNLVEDTLPGLALAFEPDEPELMLEPPRQRGTPILDLELKTMIFIIGIFTDLVLFAIFYWAIKGFLHLHYLQTVIFVALGINSLFYVFACRSLRKPIFRYNPLSNNFLTASVAVGFLILFLAVYWRPFQVLLNTHALGKGELALLFGIGLLNLFLIEATKWIFIVKAKKGRGARE